MQKIVISPLPRYISATCCSNTTHITNKGDPSLLSMVEDRVMDYRRWIRDTLYKQCIMGLRTLNPWALLMGPDYEADNKTSNTVWKEDGVHLSSSSGTGSCQRRSAMLSVTRSTNLGPPLERPAGIMQRPPHIGGGTHPGKDWQKASKNI